MKPKSTLKYQSKRPTQPGWYWCQNAGDLPGQTWEAVVRLDMRNTNSGPELACSWMTGPGLARVMHEDDWSLACLWAGPLTPPPQPKTKRS